MNIVFELIPIIITVFLIFKGNKIKEYLLNLSIANGSNIIEIIISLVITLVSVLNIFWWNENYYF